MGFELKEKICFIINLPGGKKVVIATVQRAALVYRLAELKICTIESSNSKETNLWQATFYMSKTIQITECS